MVGLAGNLVLQRFQRRGAERLSDEAARALVLRTIAAQRIAAEHLIHIIIHHDAGRR